MREPITIDEARRIVMACVKPGPAERLRLEDALDRVLAEDVVSAGDTPPFDCSAMDGFAVTAGPAGRLLHVIGESRAGHPAENLVGAGQAARISTGAAIPEGADAVIRQEDTRSGEGTVETLVDTPAGDNIRRAGEDLRAGRVVLRSGTLLGPAELAAAIGAGRSEVMVARRPSAAVVVTGDELRAPGEPLGPGEIHNSNALMLASLCRRAGALPSAESRPVPDDPERIREALAPAVRSCDVIIASGGVSVGPHDHVKPVLAALGVQERFWGVALRPGGPTWFGTAGERLVFALPGNPVSAAVTFALFVAPALRGLQGMAPERPERRSARLAAAVGRNRTRTQAVRVRLGQQATETVAEPNGPQGSHVTSSLLGADALALIPPGGDELPAGATVELLPAPGRGSCD